MQNKQGAMLTYLYYRNATFKHILLFCQSKFTPIYRSIFVELTTVFKQFYHYILKYEYLYNKQTFC